MVFCRKNRHFLIDYVTMLVYGYVYVFSNIFCNLQNLGQMMELDVETYFSDDVTARSQSVGIITPQKGHFHGVNAEWSFDKLPVF